MQQRERFDDDMKRWQMRQQAANSGRSEIAQYLGLAHQMAQDKRAQATLERQLKRDEVLERQREDELDIRRQAMGLRANKLSEETKRVGAYAASLKAPGVDQKALQTILSHPELGPALTRRIQTQWRNMDSDIVRSSPEQKDAEAISIIQQFIKDAQVNPARALVQTPTPAPAANDPEELMRRALFGGQLQ